MQVSIQRRTTIVVGVFGALALIMPGVACAQQTTGRFYAASGAGVTVSVATLRVPEKAWKHYAKAKEAAEHNRLDEADRETEKAIEIAPDFAQAYLLRADSLVQKHAFEAAIANVKEARRVEPDVTLAGVVLAGAYNGMHRYEEARLALGELHGSEKAAWQAAYEGARSAIGLSDVEGALRWSAVAMNSAPQGFIDVHLVRTNALILARRWNEAQEQLETYLQSPGRMEHRDDVLAALERVKTHVSEEELKTVASR